MMNPNPAGTHDDIDYRELPNKEFRDMLMLLEHAANNEGMLPGKWADPALFTGWDGLDELVGPTLLWITIFGREPHAG